MKQIKIVDTFPWQSWLSKQEAQLLLW